MPYYTLGQAAKATGKTKTTISNAIKKGRISAEKNDLGHYQIEVSELHRVFEPKKSRPSIDSQKVTAQDPIIDPEKILENKYVQDLLQAKEETLQQVKAERDRIYGLITNQSDQATREIEALRAKVEAEQEKVQKAEEGRRSALDAARRYKAEAEKPWYRKIFS